jgi:hypothetical protein
MSYGRVGTHESTSISTEEQSISPVNSNDLISNAALTSESLILISRRPTEHRDRQYVNVYMSVIGIMILLSLMTSRGVMSSRFILLDEEGSWTSMVMIATLMGTFLGIFLCLLIYNHDLREQLFSASLMVSICLQIGLAGIIFISDEWWALGALCILSAFLDSIKFRKARKYMTIVLSLIDTAIDVNTQFGNSICVFCILICVIQSCFLLWWSAIFVRLMGREVDFLFIVLLVVFGGSFYWTIQFFHSLISSVVEGCFLWYFLDDNNTPNVLAEVDSAALAQRNRRVLLYAQCAVTSSLGSVIKSAVWGPLSHIVLVSLHWSRERDPFGSPLNSWSREFVEKILSPWEGLAGKYNRLATGYVIIFGQTFCRAAAEVSREDISGIVLDDTTSYTLKMVTTSTAGLVAILLAILGSREEGTSWPMFVVVCFLLAYAGVSLALHAFRSGIDALIIAYSDSPQKFEHMNSIIFHRFMRTTEIPH